MVSNVTLLPEVNVTGDCNFTGDCNETGRLTNETGDYYGDDDNYGDYSEEYKRWAAAVNTMWKVMCPIVLLVGTVGNIMIILVLRKMVSEASAFPLLFMALAVTDLVLLWVVTFPRWIAEQHKVWIIDMSDAACKVMAWLEYSFVSLSAWLLAAMTAQRAMNIVFPLKMKKLKPRLLALVTIGCLAGASLVFNSFTLHGMTTEDPESEGSCWWNFEFEANVRPKLDWLEIVLNSFLPSVVMVVCNGLMIHAVMKSARKARERRSTAKPGMVSRVTVTLIVVSLAFIVLTFPYYVMQMIQQRNPELDFSGPYFFFFNIAGLMWTINSAINFFLYVITGARFREEGKKLIPRQLSRISRSTVRTNSKSDSSCKESRTTDF
ncbi:hypothetical protein BaRGS_00027660 [Batillaria attramentaria]|uniref:G-protein coupled receptors family 1 profile domain-containing protein n=1 Tax=Batillaria attramentaria TaxID=370345 RepID=A0ABD0K2P7_9CAEN